MAMKPWQKILLSVVTVGVTATAVYFGVKEIKKRMDKKKKEADGKAPVPNLDVKKDVPPRKVQLVSNLQHELKNSKMDVFQGVPDASFQKLSEAELDRMTVLIKKYNIAGGETAFKKQDPKGFTELMGLVTKVIGKPLK